MFLSQQMISKSVHRSCNNLITVGFLFFLLVLYSEPAGSQGAWYWNESLNTEASLLSGAVVAGESGIAAIYYNPATIPQMTKSNLSLSANLFSLAMYNARNALGSDFPANRAQFNVQPRILTLTLNPRKKPDLTIEMAYFCKVNDYLQINQGSWLTADIISANPGNENYSAEYYLRSRFLDYYGGIGLGYKLSNSFAIGFSGMISYKDDQYYNMLTTHAFTGPEDEPVPPEQYLAEGMYHLKYNMFDVRLITKAGIHWRNQSWSLGANLNFPSLKLFGDGTVLKQYEFSNIHTETASTETSSTFYGGRQKHCASHFKDPFSVAVGTNYYTSSGNSIILFTAEYFFGIKAYNYIEANHDPGENGYDFAPGEPEDWLSFTIRQKPVLNAGVAFRRRISGELMFSGGFRTDFNYDDPVTGGEFLEYNRRNFYTYDVYHLNSGVGYGFKRGSIIVGMQFSYGQAKNQRQVVNLTDPVEYISDSQLPLTGPINSNVQIRYYDIMVYFGFVFNFMKNENS